MYGAGAVLGYTPQEVNEMSVWQYMAAIEGYEAAHSPDDGSLSKGEIDELWDWLQV